MSDSEIPKPVAPAESITQPPAHVLDSIAHKEPGMLDRARETVMPLLNQVQEASKPYLEKAKPYTDAAIAKGHQLVDKLDAAAGLPPQSHAQSTAPGAPVAAAPSTTATATSTDTTTTHPRDLGTAASTVTAGLGAQAQAHGVPATAAEAGEKVKAVFGQISSTVTNTFNSVTHTINEKTASGDKPGILTQVADFAEKSLDKVDSYLNQADPSFRPVQTTTNTVPHVEVPSATPTTGAGVSGSVPPSQ
ncbi:hypothetical protein BD324DRAFT_235026 [Kockovaella imperatae]|uniref:Uncharacterized protein n=1 Tax=Kockovaella imperatae TaxID=4999 RepID=A0A1Y1URL5_9TREE|nr:hypothetical protein BD324DRAFT_235026 [Kockovaella imperatae]ORX39795.1 hypothetical protein BD324DRAFT_235026 [Kockovaella imperatae]